MRKHALAFAAAAAIGLGTFSTAQAADPQPGGIGQGVRDTAHDTGAAARDTANSMMKGSDQENQQALSQANDPDKLFAVCASMENEFETQLGQLAQQKAQDQKVKDIAQKVVQDHQQANQKLQQAAQAAGNWQLPKGLDPYRQQQMKVFQSLNGRDFDQQYISHLKACHAAAASMYADEAQLAKNQQIKDYAAKTLPTIQEHSQHIQTTATALGLPSGTEAQPAGARMRGSTDMNLNSPASPSTPGSGANDAGKAPERNTGTDVPRAGSPTDQGATK
jgi:putative membrane protein